MSKLTVLAESLGRGLAQRAARNYVAGPEVSSAIDICSSFQAQGISTTVCFWNDEHDSPAYTLERYLSTIESVADHALDCYASVKAPALGFSREMFGAIFERARKRNIGIHFDSLSPDAADQTLTLIRDFLPADGNIGLAIPGRWRRSISDADQAIEMGLNVRIIKGQWPDPDDPEMDMRAGFLRIVDRIAGRIPCARIATHDPQLARESLERLAGTGTRTELELLFGLPLHPGMAVAAAAGVPVRIYVPYGHAWLPYAIRQLRKNPMMAVWLLRDLWAGDIRTQGRTA